MTPVAAIQLKKEGETVGSTLILDRVHDPDPRSWTWQSSTQVSMECHVTATPSGSVRWSRPGFNLGELLKGETVKPPSYHVSISTDGTTIAKTTTTVIPPQRVKDPGGASVLGCVQQTWSEFSAAKEFLNHRQCIQPLIHSISPSKGTFCAVQSFQKKTLTKKRCRLCIVLDCVIVLSSFVAGLRSNLRECNQLLSPSFLDWPSLSISHASQ